MLSESASMVAPASQAQAYAIEARSLGKCYGLYAHPSDRLKQLLWGRWRQFSREFWALREVDLLIRPGEVVGLVGRNGAGKSTLLQMLCGTLPPTTGRLQVHGRVAALLELGAGFNPEFSGRENVYMNAAILGLDRAWVDEHLDGILSFADIGAFIDEPVKTYSSGMFVRLAFAVATSVAPDILVIDEALSVGDGAFARKSFDRIMALKDQGATILFCSHAMYHVQALCTRALWLEAGQVRMLDLAPRVTSAYETALAMIDERSAKAETPKNIANNVDTSLASGQNGENFEGKMPEQASTGSQGALWREGTASIVSAKASTDDGQAGEVIALQSGRTDLFLDVSFVCDPALEVPSVAVGIAHASGVVVASAGSANDKKPLTISPQGAGRVRLVFPALALLRGDYTVTVILACGRGLHVYELRERAISLRVVHDGLEQGLVSLPHRWETA